MASPAKRVKMAGNVAVTFVTGNQKKLEVRGTAHLLRALGIESNAWIKAEAPARL